jgi:hypothetical protein
MSKKVSKKVDAAPSAPAVVPINIKCTCGNCIVGGYDADSNFEVTCKCGQKFLFEQPRK